MTLNKRKILTSAFLPGIFGLLGTSLYVLGDTLIVGQALGREGLASLNLSIPMINVMQGLGLLLGFGGATAMSHALGRGDSKRAKAWAEKTLTWSLILGLLLLLLLQLFFTTLVNFLTGGGDALPGAREYLGILLWFSPVYILFQSLIVLLRNDGNAKLAMTALLLCSALNVALDALFIFGFGWGLFGAGLATGIAQVVGLLITLLHFKNAKVLKNLRPRLELPFRLMGKGMASFVMELSQGVVIFAFNAVLLSLVGEIGVSSYAIIANLSLMFTAVFLGLSQGAQPLFATAKGAGDEKMFQALLRFSQQVSWILSLGVVAVCMAFPKLLASIFISGDPEVLKMTLTGLRLYSLGFLFLGFNLVVTIALQSAAKSKQAFIFAVARGMMMLIAFMLGLKSIIGILGVWLTFFASELVGFIWMNIMLANERKTPSSITAELQSR